MQANTREKRLKMVLRRLANLNEAHQKVQEMNSELINKVVESELELSKAKSENFMLTKKTLDLMFMQSLNISENNKLKQLLQKLDAETNKALNAVGEISSILLNTKHCLKDNQNLFKNSGNILPKESFRLSTNMPTILKKEKKSEELIKNSETTRLSLKNSCQEIYTRKKNDREVKMFCSSEENLSPIIEIRSPQIIRYRKTLGKRFLDLENRKERENKSNSFAQIQSLLELDNGEKTTKLELANRDWFKCLNNNNGSDISIDDMPKKQTTCSNNLNSSKQRSVSKSTNASEPAVELNFLNLQKKEVSSTFEENTKAHKKREGKSKTDSTKVYCSKKRCTNISFEELLENNCYSSSKEEEEGTLRRRSERIKTKAVYNELNMPTRKINTRRSMKKLSAANILWSQNSSNSSPVNE